MTFKHKLMSEILNDEGNKIEEDKKVVRMNSVFVGKSQNDDDSENAGATQLHQFMDEISKAIRGTQFAYKAELERWVYMSDEPYPMGYIGFGDYRQTTSGDAKFVVCSRKIHNMKYATHSTPYNMRMNVKLETAVRNAKKFLLNYSPMELAEVDKSVVRRAIDEARELAAREARQDAREVGLIGGFQGDGSGTLALQDTLLNELRHLLNTGHEFVDAGYGAKLRPVLESMKGLAAQSEQVNMHFVRGYERFGEQAFVVVPVDEINSYKCTVRDEVARYTDDLPEDIMGRVAALSMMADKSYVDGVGYRVDGNMFYVVR